MAERKRDKTLTIRVLDSELAMLAQLSEREGVTVSEWMRNTIRREHVVAFGAKPRRKK